MKAAHSLRPGSIDTPRNRSIARLASLENGYIARLDQRFVARRDRFLDKLKTALPEELHRSVLDLGCGDGIR